MENNLKKKLNEELEGELAGLSSLVQGSEEHSAAVESAMKLYKLKIEEDNNEREAENRKKQNKSQNLNQWLTLGVTAAIGIANIALNWYFCERGFRFEEEGTYTSQTHKNLFPKFKR